MSQPVLIYGSRILARLARDVLETRPDEFQFAGYVDDVNQGSEIIGTLDKVAGSAELAGLPICPAIGYSNLPARWEAIQRARAAGFRLLTLTDPSVYLGRETDIAPGCLLLPRATVDREARLGSGTVLWPCATIAHECQLGENVIVCSHAILAGQVRVGSNCFIGIGANVADKISIGDHCFVGAGVWLFEDLPPNTRLIARPNGIRMPVPGPAAGATNS